MPILTRGNPLFTSPSTNLSPDQDALRWRALLERVQRLEQQLGKTVKYGQIGAAGGSDIIAQRLRDAGGRFVIDLGNGVATVSDTSNTIRAQMGNLAANGVSPAQYGFRANDANGVPLFDSLGIIGNPKLLGSNSTTTAQTIVGPATNVAVTNSSVTFSLVRQQKILTIFQLTAQPGNGTPSGFAYANLRMDSAASGIYSQAFIYGPSPAAYQNCTMVRQDTLAAGSHTADMTISSVDNGTTLSTWQCQTFCYAVGS